MINSVSLLWIGFIVLALLLLRDQWLSPDDQSQSPASTAQATDTQQLERRINALEGELTEALLQRQAIERRLTQLEQGNPVAIGDGEESLPVETRGDTDAAEERSQGENTNAQQESLTLEQRMIAAGIPSDTIQSIQQRIDRNRLQMLELRNTAIRDGWSDTEEYTERINELSNATRGLREEFGDEVFDEYLYASGRPNRVRINEVYQGSAAANAGLQPGDILVGYGSSRIFSMSALRQSTVEGTVGESVLVELIRDGQPITTTITRGPMGISMTTTRVKP